MWGFKSVTIDNVSAQVVETAIRKFTARRHTPLDLQSSSTYVSTENFFLGLEKKKSIEITRIRSPFERLLPKIVIKFDKEIGFTRYKIRYTFLSFLLLIVLSLGMILNVIYFVTNSEREVDFPTLAISSSLFLLLSFFEINLTKAKLQRAIDNVQQLDIAIK